ncbi:MAG: protein kinase [Acidobacteriia bacterium]|nr:protein kinase [Terriglobia bacterium]
MKTCPTCQGSYPNNFAICPQDGSPLTDTGTWSEGSIIRGKYRLLTKVGQGGMGAVYKALHLAFDELRALKVIAPELLSDELFVKRFKHEAVITRKLQHPNAVRVDDIDEAEDGRPFIVMEFIEGQSLKQLIREEGPLPVQRVCIIIKQAAAALDAAHRLGMVHRDIKPDNIALVDRPEGEMVKVLDFGIAKVKEARMGESAGMTLTGTGVVIGTPQYMSPEQAMGKRGDELDGRADLYSLGIVMYQMLTADLPFKADTTMEMLLAHMQKPPAPISVVHPELQVPEPVAALTMRLLEKNRDMRPASARVLIQEIEKAEKEMANVGKTRIMTAEEVRADDAGRAAVGGDRAAAGGAIPPRPQPRPVEPAKVAPRPQPQPVPHPSPRPKPPESRWGMWVALIVLVVGLGGGGLYIFFRSPAPQPPGPTGTLTATLTAEPTTVERGQSVMLHWSSQNATDLDLEPGVGKVQARGSTSVTPEDSTTYTLTATGRGGTQDASAHVSVTIPPTPLPPPPAPVPSDERFTTKKKEPKRMPEPKPSEPVRVDLARVKSAITQGDFFLKRGEYDSAINAYQEGLNLDPSNQQLRDKLEQTKKARDIERRVLQ